MRKVPRQPYPRTSFNYEDREVVFQSVSDDDYILNVMRRQKTFYEKDVLERIRDRLGKRKSDGAALDVGAFIGTHSVYFSMFCGCKPVYAFEANPQTFPILQGNLERNGLELAVFSRNLALGAKSGHAKILPGTGSNLGSSSVDYVNDGNIEVSTVDEQVVANAQALRKVALMKIDVEGAELEVLAGARKTLLSYRPILCIEIHTRENLGGVLHSLSDCQYWIVDCRGRSPTYIIEPTTVSSLRRSLVNSLWLIRASSKSRRMKRHLRKLARMLTIGK